MCVIVLRNANMLDITYAYSCKGFKLCAQAELNWARIAVWSLEKPPELARILSSHFT